MAKPKEIQIDAALRKKFLGRQIRIVRRGDWECWIWQGYLVGKGYGGLKHDRRMYLAHRISYELFVGRIPAGLVIDHLCRTHGCVNPDHLEVVTIQENTLRGVNIPASFKRRTHCDFGHLFSGDNLYVTPQGWRRCRRCQRDYWHKRSIRRPARLT